MAHELSEVTLTMAKKDFEVKKRRKYVRRKRFLIVFKEKGLSHHHDVHIQYTHTQDLFPLSLSLFLKQQFFTAQVETPLFLKKKKFCETRSYIAVKKRKENFGKTSCPPLSSLVHFR